MNDSNAMNTKKYILVVDDNAINRKVLTLIISESYECLEAENGEDALKILEENQGKILAVMLDIVMPVMDGYEFLRAIENFDEYKNIPIIVTTCKDSEENEIKALELGAWDFVSKPYEANIIKFRLKNAIKRSQLLATEKLSYIMTYDQVTGLYNKQNFFMETKKLLEIYEKDEFALYRLDIDKFKYISFGSNDGDRIIEIFVNALHYIMSTVPCCTLGRMDTEVFALCFSEKFLDVDTFIETLTDKIDKSIGDYNIDISLGINKIDDHSESVESIYEKATFATEECKKNPYSKYEYYNNSMHTKLNREISLMKGIYSAFKNNQFVVSYYPQYHVETRDFYGAEAVAVWNSSENGKIYPEEYLGLVRSDFTEKIDEFLVKEVCNAINEGVSSPIIIKLSNRTLYNPEIVNKIIDIIDDNDVDHDLICFDISEKAFDESKSRITDSIARFIIKDFKIQVSDFGKGKSSLDALSNILFSRIKVDPSFIFTSSDMESGKLLLDLITRYSEMHNIDVVVENKNYDESAFGSSKYMYVQDNDVNSLIDKNKLKELSNK